MTLRRFLYWANFSVLRWQLLLFSGALFFILHRLYESYWPADTQLGELAGIFLNILKQSMIWIVSIAIGTTLLVWAFFWYQIRNNRIKFSVTWGDNELAEAGLVPVTITVTKLIRPFAGTVKARLVFRDNSQSDSFVLDENLHEKGSFIRKAVKGTGQVSLHNRGLHDLAEIQVHFCDMLRLVALPLPLPTQNQIFTLPKTLDKQELRVNPNNSEEQTQRIEIPKKVVGEYLNYKDFETGDDVRRIVWKIYARSGQLVVRIPETRDPYASHLYFYAGFYNSISPDNEGIFEKELLNVYKDRVRNLFEGLLVNEFQVKMPLDQEKPKLNLQTDKNAELFSIASCIWQNQMTPDQFVEIRKAAFVCLSSLTPLSEVERLFGNLPMNVPVVMVRLSDAIGTPFSFKFRNLFFVSDKSPADQLRRPWLFSPLYSKLRDNEYAIDRLFRQRGNALLINPSGKL
jgi:Protein of unknown function DUF58